MKPTQKQKILIYLSYKGNRLTPLSALRMFGCFRLASRISDLKKVGWVFDKQMIHRNGKCYASYALMGFNLTKYRGHK